MAIPSFKLSQFFKLFKPEYVLGTTYTISFAFFESVVLPCIDRRNLKKCVLLCDKHGFQRATSEAFALRSATREYLAAPVPCVGSFHPKVWVMVGEGKIALLVGSGNLTQSGFIENLELFEIVELEAGGNGKQLALSTAKFLGGLADMWPAQDSRLLVVDSLLEIQRAVQKVSEELTDDDAGLEFLTSIDGPFPESLARTIDQPDELHVASPYFGGSLAGIKRLNDTLSPKNIRVFPALHGNSLVDLPLEEANQMKNVSTGGCKSLSKKSRFSHLKLYGLRKRDRYWMFTSSVNCTEAALSGKNIEAGILRSVSETKFREYFPKKYELEIKASGRLESTYSSTPWFMFWATDIGERIVLSTRFTSKLPLTNVELEFRAGGFRCFVTQNSLFENSGEASLRWSLFGEGRRRGNAARVLELRALDADGNEVKGAAFIDDLAALTSEPKHRGAWRAAVALLSLEGIPQYADIAALFSLIEDVAFDIDEETESTRAIPAGSTTETKSDKTAVWPPVPIEPDFNLLTGGGRSGGHLHWFDRILASLVRRPHEPAGDPVVVDETDDETDESAVVDATPAEIDPQVLGVCNRMWKHSFETFCSVERRLFDMQIENVDQAKRLWGPVTFMFLGTLAVRKAVQKASSAAVEVWTVTDLVRDYIQLMFLDRDQVDNFNPLSDCVYPNGVFPPLAVDLASRFQVFPHPDISCILLLCMAHLHAFDSKMKQTEFILIAWLYFQDVAVDQIELALEDKEHLRAQWQHYFFDEQEGLSWLDIEKSFKQLLLIGWNDHEGFRNLKSKTEPINQDRFQIMDSPTEACENSGCPNSGMVNPVSARELRNLNPVVCDGCQNLLIPARLYDALIKQGAQDGEDS